MLKPTSRCLAANRRACFFKVMSTLSQQPWATSSRRAWGRWSRSSATWCCPAWFVLAPRDYIAYRPFSRVNLSFSGPCISALICAIWCFSSQEFAQYHLNKSSKYEAGTRKELLKGLDSFSGTLPPCALILKCELFNRALIKTIRQIRQDRSANQGTSVCFFTN